MSQFVRVSEDEVDEPIEIPAEEDGTLLLTTLIAQYPGACGLKYRSRETGGLRGIRLADGSVHPPDGYWGETTYIVVFPKGMLVFIILKMCCFLSRNYCVLPHPLYLTLTLPLFNRNR